MEDIFGFESLGHVVFITREAINVLDASVRFIRFHALEVPW